MKRFATGLALLLVCVMSAPAVSAAVYPLPGKSSAAAVICNGCEGTNKHGEPNKGLPTWSYGAPLSKHVGRLVDSSSTKDVQNVGIRTVRGGLIRLAPVTHGSAPPSVYIEMGGAVAAYRLDTFFTSKLPGGMKSIADSFAVSNSRTFRGDPNESVTPWDAYMYIEAYRENGFQLAEYDIQDSLGDFDWDDRGYVYGAFTVFGWVIGQDAGTVNGSLMNPLKHGANGASTIIALKSGGNYYVAVGNSAGHNVFNVTNPGSPSVIGAARDLGIVKWARHEATKRVATIDSSGKLRIYNYDTLIQGGGPEIGPLAGAGDNKFADVAADESGNFWAIESSGSFTAAVQRFAAGGSATAIRTPVGEQFNGTHITAQAGHVAVAGMSADGTDVILFKVEGTGIRKLDINNYFKRYYHAALRGYAQPAADRSYVAIATGIQLVKWNNRTYLIYNAHGMGDVFEIESGDNISSTMKTTNFGATNPHSKAPSGSGPYVGDVVKFTAASSNPSVPYQLSWNFNNPESGVGLKQASTGAEVSHQFSGYTTAGDITSPKTVTATATSDATITDSVSVTLKVPTARIGVSSSTTPVTSAATSLNVVLGDTFNDASDGSVESHFATWSIDGVPTKALPGASIPVGTIGAHSVTLTGSYGRYDAPTFTPTAPVYTASVANVPYTVRPFIFALSAAKSGADAVFSAGTPRVTTVPGVLTATQWTVTWAISGTHSATVPAPQAVAIGTIPALSVPANALNAGNVVTLTVEVPAANLVGGTAEYAKFTQSMTLDKPVPAIAKTTGCVNANTPCTLTVSGNSVSDSTVTWSITKDGSPFTSGTGLTISPNLTAAGNYRATATAVKGIFEGVATLEFSVAASLCGPPPTIDQVSINVNCGSGGCVTGNPITFKADTFGYTRQNCDVYTWRFGDTNTPHTGTPQTHTYTAANKYTVRLTVSNSSGNPATEISEDLTITGGGVDPDPPQQTCSRPTNVTFSYSGNKGCAPGTPCKVGEKLNFTGLKNGGFLSASCDSATWDFGDASSGSGRTTTHTYTAAGSYTVTIRASSSGGTATAYSATIPVVNDTVTGCSLTPTDADVIMEFKGSASNCTGLNGAFCSRGETIQFDAKPFRYTYQTCDKFEWNFGDGGTSTLRNPTHAFTGSAPSYDVTVRIYNTNNPTGFTLGLNVPFDSAPVLQTPVITLNAPVSVAKGQTVTFTANSDIPATGWSWNFGDSTAKDNSQATLKSNSSTVTHTYAKTGNFTVTITAKNAEDTGSASASSALSAISVTDTPLYSFLLPAVIHDGGQNGSSWRTDVQVYYSAPNPVTEPLTMTATFLGQETPLVINKSTFIYEDFVGKLISGNGRGAVLLTTQTKYKPQIWTRTYNVDASGKTYGQFIPAIELTGPTGSSTVSPTADPVKYYLPGLLENSRYRTNLGFINPNTTEVIANVVVYDDLRIPLTQFAVTVPPFENVPINGLGSKVPNLPNRPITLEISVPAGKWLVAYASFIDGISNDPAYIPAVADSTLASPSYAAGSITPGVGHTGDWRSDVTIFNPDSSAVRVDLHYYDAVGLPRGEAKGIVIGAGQLKSYTDLLKVSGLWTATPPDGLGMLRVTTTTPVTRYPLTFSRTYNQKGSGGTFGQGIPGFAAGDANVKPGKPAIIPAVRSDANYKTNIGLTNTTANPVSVIVRLLDPNTGIEAKALGVTLSAHETVVGGFDFGGLTTGTFKVEITGGQGAVWAFASIINQGNDPEYVPGIPVN